jgi:hypothetical protein
MDILTTIPIALILDALRIAGAAFICLMAIIAIGAWCSLRK